MTPPDVDRSSLQLDRPKKLQRISQACDLCHRRSIRCRPSNEAPQTQCQNCYDFAVECTYNRPSKRKKHSKTHDAPSNLPTSSSASSVTVSLAHQASLSNPQSTSRRHSGLESAPSSTVQPSSDSAWHLRPQQTRSSQSDLHNPPVHLQHYGPQIFDSPAHDSQSLYAPLPQTEELSTAWRAFALSSEGAIGELLVIYMDIIYPTYVRSQKYLKSDLKLTYAGSFPLFHEARLEIRVRSKEYLHSRGIYRTQREMAGLKTADFGIGFFAAIMGACALVSAHIADNAIPSSYVIQLTKPQISTEIFYSAACDALSKDMTKNLGIEFLRACTLIALTCLQRGHIGGMQQYLGTFYSLVAVQRFYDEKHWPLGLSDVDLEINRRIYWATYCLDISASAIWGSFMRSQEVHTGVRYPGDIRGDKEDSAYHHSNDENLPRWVVGWHFTIDLYRVLEHVLNKYRLREFQHSDRRGVTSLVFGNNWNDVDVMQTVLQLYYGLPPVLKDTPPLSGDASLDIYAYQAANIQATLQLLRMMMLSSEETVDVERRCEVVSDVLSAFSAIPVDYLRAMNTPLIYHLGTVGKALAAVRQEVLSETAYRRLRAALATMADLLDNVGRGLNRFVAASQTLRHQISDLDNAIRSKRMSSQDEQQPRSAGGSVSTTHGTPSIMPSLGLGQHQSQQQPQPQPQPQPPQHSTPYHHSQHQRPYDGRGGNFATTAPMRSSILAEPVTDHRFGSIAGESPGEMQSNFNRFPPELMGDWTVPVLYEHVDVPPLYQQHLAQNPH